jgi:hypothetical protein
MFYLGRFECDVSFKTIGHEHEHEQWRLAILYTYLFWFHPSHLFVTSDSLSYS